MLWGNSINDPWEIDWNEIKIIKKIGEGKS